MAQTSGVLLFLPRRRAAMADWTVIRPAVRSPETVLHVAGMALFGGTAIAGRGTIRWLERRRHPERHVFVAIDGRLEGLLELHSVPHPEAAATVQALQARGLDVCLISGDREAPTRSLAESLGIRRYRAEALPADKSEYVDGLVGAGRTVCFVGDGINDLPAMRRASIAISIGGATTAAVSAAEVVLLDKTLAQLAPLFGLAEEMRGNLHRSAQVTLGPGLVCAAGVLLFHWGILATLVAYNAALVAGLTNGMLPALKERTERRTASFSPSSTSQAHGRGRYPGSTVRPDPTPDISNDRSLIGPGHGGRT